MERFRRSLRDECLDREFMLSVAEARVVIEDYRSYYNEVRPHGGIGYHTPTRAFIEAQTPDTTMTTPNAQSLIHHQELLPVPPTEPLTRSGPYPGPRSGSNQ